LTILLPNDVACKRQLPSPLVNSGYSFGHDRFIFTHQLSRSEVEQKEKHVLLVVMKYIGRH
jgi:hypothetical protein